MFEPKISGWFATIYLARAIFKQICVWHFAENSWYKRCIYIIQQKQQLVRQMQEQVL